jgi:thioesterase domain-containing protein
MIATRLVDDILMVQADGPFFLGGYSFGGLVALEMARQLLARGKSIGLLVLIDALGPGYPRKRSHVERLRLRLGLILRQPIAMGIKALRNLAARLERTLSMIRVGILRVLGKRRANDGDPCEKSGLNEMINRVRNAYLTAMVRYSGRVTLVRATECSWSVDRAYDNPHNGWDTVAEGGVEVVPVRVAHLKMFEEPALSEVAEAIRTRLLASNSSGCAINRDAFKTNEQRD